MQLELIWTKEVRERVAGGDRERCTPRGELEGERIGDKLRPRGEPGSEPGGEKELARLSVCV